MVLVLASRNKKKIGEMRTLLSQMRDIEVLSLDDIGYTGDIEEDGRSFTENAMIKANVPAKMGYIGIAHDSGLEVDALGGAPGIFSARFAGGHASDEANNAKLLSELKDVPSDKRGARYVCAIACVFPDGRILTVQDTCKGRIIDTPRGEGGFGYDPYFYIDEKGMTFAEMTAEAKHAMSHRGKAMRRFAKMLALYTEDCHADE